MILFLIALLLKLIILDFPISLLLVIIYSAIWMRAANRIIIRYALPRASPKKVEKISRMYRLRHLDSRLAYFLGKWLSSLFSRVRSRGRMRTLPEFRRIILPSGESYTRTTRRTSSIAEMYEDMARVREEIREELERIERLIRRTIRGELSDEASNNETRQGRGSTQSN